MTEREVDGYFGILFFFCLYVSIKALSIYGHSYPFIHRLLSLTFSSYVSISKMAKSFLSHSDRKAANRNIIILKLKETIDASFLINITVNRAERSNITLYVNEMKRYTIVSFPLILLSICLSVQPSV